MNVVFGKIQISTQLPEFIDFLRFLYRKFSSFTSGLATHYKGVS